MSLPKLIIQTMVIGGQIFGRALAAAGRQAYKNTQYRPDAENSAQRATGSAMTDKLTREQNMTSDEARLILGVRGQESMEQIMAHYEHLFKANSPPAPPAAGEVQNVPKFTSARNVPYTSHYLLSKVVRARERLEAEVKLQAEAMAAESNPKPTTDVPPETPKQDSPPRPPPSV